MTTNVDMHGVHDQGTTLGGLRFAVFTTRNMVFMLAVLAMNYTLMRPSPVDMLFILSFVMTLFHLTLFKQPFASRRAFFLALLLGAWGVSYTLPSLAWLNEPFVLFELIAKTFAISIGLIGAFVAMTWKQRQFETFMKVYIVSCIIGSILGTIGFLLQMELLTWDGRAKGLIDDPNMYGSFLIPAVVFCAYFLSKGRGGTLYYLGAMAVVMLGILLSFSRIAAVATVFCLVVYLFFHYRRKPARLMMVIGGVVAIGAILLAIASVTSAEFTAKLFDRLTFAKSYDLGEEGRYNRYLLVVPMILGNPLGIGVLQLEKIFPEPIHNIWLSSFVNYGWGGGFTWITLVISSLVVSIHNYWRTRNEITIALLISLVGIVMCCSLHEGEHWRHMWLAFGMVWGVNVYNLGLATRQREAVVPVAGSPAPNSAVQRPAR
jgi:hypothetical protein